MDLKEYQELCKRTAMRSEDKNSEIVKWGLGISGEAGDVASCIKKTVFHGNDQKAGIKENLGDTLWYTAMICNHFNWDLEEVLKENIAKLKKRFPNGFSFESVQKKETIDWGEK